MQIPHTMHLCFMLIFMDLCILVVPLMYELMFLQRFRCPPLSQNPKAYLFPYHSLCLIHVPRPFCSLPRPKAHFFCLCIHRRMEDIRKRFRCWWESCVCLSFLHSALVPSPWPCPFSRPQNSRFSTMSYEMLLNLKMLYQDPTAVWERWEHLERWWL